MVLQATEPSGMSAAAQRPKGAKVSARSTVQLELSPTEIGGPTEKNDWFKPFKQQKSSDIGASTEKNDG